MLSFLFKRSDYIVTKTISIPNKVNIALFQRTGRSLPFSKPFSSHSQEQLYIPFAIDSAREHASIKFWVSKNTNLREVNVNIRVWCNRMILYCREHIYLSGVFHLIVMYISITVQLFHIILTWM